MKNEFKSKSLYFNRITDHGDYVEKSSVNSQKLREEYHFLTRVPDELKSYYPEVFDYQEDSHVASYKIKKLPELDASHLLVCEKSFQLEKINSILEKLLGYFKLLPSIQPSMADYQKSILKNIYVKNISRMREVSLLPEYEQFNSICRTYGYTNVHEYCDAINQELRESFQSVRSKKLFFSHGDLRFSNIFKLDDSLVLIDPKGYYGDVINTYRTIHYDLAKISLSLMGRYDLINHELFKIEDSQVKFTHEWQNEDLIEKKFSVMLKELDAELSLVRKLEASLLLSLIPFHKESEKKMTALLIRSLGTFKQYSG